MTDGVNYKKKNDTLVCVYDNGKVIVEKIIKLSSIYTYYLQLEVTEVGCKSIRLEWSKPEDFSVEHCLFELSMDEYARTWVVIYR